LSDLDKEFAKEIGIGFARLGFEIVATGGTHKALVDAGVDSKPVLKISLMLSLVVIR
jgi:carbamoyl-phosphate synthase large subunit